LTVKDIATRIVDVPMRRALATGGGALRSVPLVLIDLTTEEGIVGHAYLFVFRVALGRMAANALADAAEALRGDAVAPAEMQAKLARRHRLAGLQGVLMFAASGVDVAAWDALAKAAGAPLARLLGGTLGPVSAYNSNGLGISSPAAVGEEAVELLADGFDALKLRLGYPTLEGDLAAVRAVKKRIPAGTPLMTDYNQSLSVAEAVRRGRALDGEGVYWLEEPVRHDDYAGNARVAAEVATPVQIGENFIEPWAMMRAIEARACDFVMPDLQRIGGVTGWLRAAAIAEAHGLPMSSHLFPEVSAHLLRVTATAHWLEFVDWAAPILAEPLKVKDGRAALADRPGVGLTWDEAAVKRYRVA
jgi:mandelate racemase